MTVQNDNHPSANTAPPPTLDELVVRHYGTIVEAARRQAGRKPRAQGWVDDIVQTTVLCALQHRDDFIF